MTVYVVVIVEERGVHDVYREFMIDKVFSTESAANEHCRKQEQRLYKYNDYKSSYNVEVVEAELCA